MAGPSWKQYYYLDAFQNSATLVRAICQKAAASTKLADAVQDKFAVKLFATMEGASFLRVGHRGLSSPFGGSQLQGNAVSSVALRVQIWQLGNYVTACSHH